MGHPPVQRRSGPRSPDDYCPEGDVPPEPGAWDRPVAAFRGDLQAIMDLVANPATGLFAPIPHGQGQVIYDEALPWPTTTPTTWAGS